MVFIVHYCNDFQKNRQDSFFRTLPNEIRDYFFVISFISTAFSFLNVLIAGETFLSDLLPVTAAQGSGTLGYNIGVNGKLLSVAGQPFQYGLGTHAKSRIVYDLDRQYSRFEANVGVDDAMKDYTGSSIVGQHRYSGFGIITLQIQRKTRT